MNRDSEQTKQDIVEAVGRLLAAGGPDSIGVNAVAREAGVDKVLIYRYFGGLPGLLREFARSGSFWPTNDELLKGVPETENASALELASSILEGHLAALLDRPLTQEIMRWELLERNELTDELARVREEQGRELLARMPVEQKAGNLDVAAVGALLHAGISYLVLRAKTADVYLGVDLTSNAGWERLRSALRPVLGACFAHIENEGKQSNSGGVT